MQECSKVSSSLFFKKNVDVLMKHVMKIVTD
jgi:hypothetical protein